MWYRYATRDHKDDTLLLAVIREFDGTIFISIPPSITVRSYS